MDGAYNMYDREDIHTVFGGGKPEGKTPLGRSKRGREDNIRMGMKGVGWKRVD